MSLTQSDLDRYRRQGFNRVPLIAESFADLETPLSLYLKLANTPNTFLLESVVGGERFGRYSFIGLPARTRLATRLTPHAAETVVTRDGKEVERDNGDPLAFVDSYQRRFRAATRSGLPRFCGGINKKPQRSFDDAGVSGNRLGHLRRPPREGYTLITFSAWGPFWPCVTSNSTRSPSWRVL